MHEYQHLARRLLESPLEFVDAECVIALRAFWAGYQEVYLSLTKVGTLLRAEVHGPSNADAFTCALLEHESRKAAFYWILEKMLEIPLVGIDVETRKQPELTSFIGLVRQPIMSKRYALLLGEPTVSWLHNFQCGFHFGLSSAYPLLAEEEEQTIRAFEDWLRAKYRSPEANWATMIRVFEGPCERGLESFLELFERFSEESH